MAIPSSIQEPVRLVVEWVVEGRYSALAEAGALDRVSEDECRQAVSDYFAILITPPAEIFESKNADAVRLNDNRGWAVIVPFWSREEGESDLALELTVWDGPPMITVIDNILVP